MKPKSRERIFLVGRMTNQILGAKLPSKRQVLAVLFHKMRIESLSLRESARDVIRQTHVFWQKSGNVTRQDYHSVAQLEKLYSSWRDLEKRKNTEGNVHRDREQIFEKSLDELFDIAHADAYKLAKSDDSKEFLIAQREDGRKGCLLGADMKLVEKEQRIAERKEKEEKRKRKYNQEQSKQGKILIKFIQE